MGIDKDILPLMRNLLLYLTCLFAVSISTATLRATEPVQATKTQTVDSVDGLHPEIDSCGWVPICDATPPVVHKRPFHHGLRSMEVIHMGLPTHQGRDQIYAQDAPAQWAIAQFSYGPTSKSLENEDVDVFIDHGCSGEWIEAGTFRTTLGHHPTVAGVKDRKGYVYVDLVAQGHRLDAGRHRVRFVVAGDLTAIELFIDVLPADAKIAVTDIDGTLTSSEYALLKDVVGAGNVAAHPDAAKALTTLSARGYHIVYIASRPEWLQESTRQWLAKHGFPRGILHTSTSETGGATSMFEAQEFSRLKADTHLVPSFAFGNNSTEVESFAAAGIPRAHSYFYRLEGNPQGGQVFQDYASLIPIFQALPLCHSPHE